MAEFKKYMHIERFGNDEVEGIELGDCYVFPKLDGTNASVWLLDDGTLGAGSRNRPLSIEEDNAGFCAWALANDRLVSLLAELPHLRMYGEWLVPHSLKTYREDAWKRFFVFDVEDVNTEELLHYDEYKPFLDYYGIDYIPPLCVFKNATYDALTKELDNNKFLIDEGKGNGEGIVLKNYGYKNRFGRVCWAKIVTNTFKEKHVKEMGAPVKKCKQMVEQQIADEFVTKHLVDKVYAKIVNENSGWNSKYIPRLLSTVYYDLVNEEMWNAVKKLKNPTVNFKTLNTVSTLKIKEIRPELF